MTRKVDMHLHTYASDGQWSPEEVVEQLDKNKIKIFSVTDHDQVACVSKVAQLVENRKDLTYIKGVEGTVTYRGIEHHILTYYIDENNEELLAMLASNRAVRESYEDRLMDWLHESYPQVSPEGLKSYDYNPFQGGWKAFAYLRDGGIIESLKDYFALTKDFVEKKTFLAPEVYLPKMLALGYKTVLAHPPAYGEGDLYDYSHLDYFRKLGLQGIECYTKYLKDQKNSQYYVDYCNKYQLMITGGSDCHGGFAGRQIGHPNIDEAMVRLK